MRAVHGAWCNSVTWRTKCRYCREPVFFFQCDCGSGVFFDQLGPPWPLHDCDRSWAGKLRRWKDDSGGLNVEIAPGITVRRPPEGSIDPGVASRAIRRVGRPDPIEAIQPEGSEEVTVVGVPQGTPGRSRCGNISKAPRNFAGVGVSWTACRGKMGKGHHSLSVTTRGCAQELHRMGAKRSFVRPWEFPGRNGGSQDFLSVHSGTWGILGMQLLRGVLRKQHGTRHGVTWPCSLLLPGVVDKRDPAAEVRRAPWRSAGMQGHSGGRRRMIPRRLLRGHRGRFPTSSNQARGGYDLGAAEYERRRRRETGPKRVR